MSRRTLLLSCIVLFGLLVFALGVLSMLHIPLEPADKTPATTIWSQTYGGIREEQAYSLIQTSDGGYAIAGRTSSFGSDYSCFWLVKVDSSGNLEWNKTYEGTGFLDAMNIAYSVVEASDGGYAIAGTAEPELYDHDFWLVKVDSSGNLEWNKTYGGPDVDVATSVVETSDGGYALAGDTMSSYGIRSDFWLVKVDSSGNLEWNKTYGGPDVDVATSVVETSDGGYALAGQTSSFGAGSFDFWLVKTDVSGNMQWDKTYGGIGLEQARSLIQTSDGGYALAGQTSSFGDGSDNFWLVKTDVSGNMQWDKTYGGTGEEKANSLIQTSDGGYALAGETRSSIVAMPDFWLVKVDSSGNLEWNKTYGGPDMDIAYSVVEASDGGYALAGYTDSFGAGSSDFWLVKTESIYDETDENGAIPQFPSWIIATIAIIVIGGVALLVYFTKVKKTTEKAE
jgi:hypothetical protein